MHREVKSKCTLWPCQSPAFSSMQGIQCGLNLPTPICAPCKCDMLVQVQPHAPGQAPPHPVWHEAAWCRGPHSRCAWGACRRIGLHVAAHGKHKGRGCMGTAWGLHGKGMGRASGCQVQGQVQLVSLGRMWGLVGMDGARGHKDMANIWIQSSKLPRRF